MRNEWHGRWAGSDATVALVLGVRRRCTALARSRRGAVPDRRRLRAVRRSPVLPERRLRRLGPRARELLLRHAAAAAGLPRTSAAPPSASRSTTASASDCAATRATSTRRSCAPPAPDAGSPTPGDARTRRRRRAPAELPRPQQRPLAGRLHHRLEQLPAAAREARAAHPRDRLHARLPGDQLVHRREAPSSARARDQ